MRTVLLAASAALALATPAGAAAPNGSGGSGADRVVWTTVTAAQATRIVQEMGGTVTETGAGEQGWTINFTFANGLNGYAEGLDCTDGPGPDAVCSDLEIGSVFTADDLEHAQRLERELSFMWVADFADPANGDYQIWRRDCLHGGMTRAQVVMLFQIMQEQVLATSYAIWPEDGSQAPNRTVDT